MNIYTDTVQLWSSIQGPKLHSALLATCEAILGGTVSRETRGFKPERKAYVFLVSRCWFQPFWFRFLFGKDFHFDKPIYCSSQVGIFLWYCKKFTQTPWSNHSNRGIPNIIKYQHPRKHESKNGCFIQLSNKNSLCSVSGYLFRRRHVTPPIQGSFGHLMWQWNSTGIPTASTSSF